MDLILVDRMQVALTKPQIQTQFHKTAVCLTKSGQEIWIPRIPEMNLLMPIMGPAITIMGQGIPATKAVGSRAMDLRREKHLDPLRQAKCRTMLAD
jgi:hypothetical protein